MATEGLAPGAAAASPPAQGAQPLKAALWMGGAIVSFSCMAIAGREVSVELDTFELMAYRSIIGVAIMCTVLTALGRWSDIRSRRLGLHLIRNISHFTGQNLWFYAITVLPLAQVIAIEFSAPVWVALLAPLFLAERLTAVRAFSTLIGFAGILVAARPDFSTLDPGLLAAAGAAVGFAGSILATKLLTRTETIFCILFWLTVIQTVFGLVCAGYDGDMAVPTGITWVFVALVGVAGVSAHLCLTTALSLAPATVVMPMDFLRLPVIAALGALFYAERLEIWVAVGAAMIFGANYLNTWYDSRARRRAGTA